MSEGRAVWLGFNAIATVLALVIFGSAAFDYGARPFSDTAAFGFCAPVFLSWLLYFGSRS